MFTIIAIFTLLCILVYTFNDWYRKGFIQDLHRKSVFITGTDSGFGRKLALDLDLKGLTVYAGCYSDQGSQELQKCASTRMKIFKLDVTCRDSIIRAKEFVEINLPANQGLWALVNNAGINKGCLFEFASMQDYRDVLAVNFFGAIEVIEIFLPLIKRSHGRIVNLISIMGRCSLTAGPYSASKFALMAYSDGLRRTTRPFGIKVSIIEPGFFKTGMTTFDSWLQDVERQWANSPPQLREQYGEEFISEVKEGLKEFAEMPPLTKNNTLEMVTNSITHAIGAKRPKDRYVVGFDAKYLYRPMTFLPDYVLDFCVYFRSRKALNAIVTKE